jgi:hypothetical protein
MISPNPIPQHAVVLPKNTATPPAATVPQHTRAGTAANDDAAVANLEHEENPLWIMAIALGVFCAFAAILMTFG